MAEKEQVLREKVEHSGLFDFPSLYSFAHSWFKEAGFGVTEDKYSEKTSGNSRDIDIEWTATKNITDYFKFEYKVKFEIKNLTEVEVEIDGQKKTMNKGKVSVEIKATLFSDRDSKWDKSPFYRFMRDVYNKYIIPSRVDEMRGEIADGAYNFKEEIKAFLDLSGRR